MDKLDVKKEKVIYTFNAYGFLLYPVMKSFFELSDIKVYQDIRSGFELLQKQLSIKDISYDDLKGALIPNQDSDKKEICLVIDAMQVDDLDYGRYVFDKLIPLLDKKSTYSILCGDYVDILQRLQDSQTYLYSALNEVLERSNVFEYKHSNQYFLIYFNRLSSTQQRKIVEGICQYPWFTGVADLTYSSRFKTYCSLILTSVCIKNRGKIIASHPSDYMDDENVNMRGFPFEENGYTFYSINEDSFGSFLSYKIEKHVSDKTDVSFSFNALFPKFNSIEKIDLKILDEKWFLYLTDRESGKGKLLETLGYGPEKKEDFQRAIFRQIREKYIYNLRQNEYGDLMFNVCVELPTVDKSLRRTTIALKYLPEKGEISVITIT